MFFINNVNLFILNTKSFALIMRDEFDKSTRDSRLTYSIILKFESLSSSITFHCELTLSFTSASKEFDAIEIYVTKRMHFCII